MGVFAVTMEKGPAWDGSRGRREQDGWDEHAAFMDMLVGEGFVLLGGPLGDGERVLLAVEAADETAVHARLAADPWDPAGLLRTGRVEPWLLWLDGRPQRDG
jgi:uncharacterized protein YciI